MARLPLKSLAPHGHNTYVLQSAMLMNRFEKFFGLRSEAKVRFRDGEFQVLNAGDFVRCAVSGQVISLEDLRYWNVDRQEAYATAEISLKRYMELKHRQRR
jgi:hypothetical protein